MRLRPLAVLFTLLLAAAFTHGGDDTGAPAPETSLLHLDLTRAIELAIEKNFQIEASAYLPDIARQRLRSASGEFDPTLQFSYDRSEATDRTISNAFGPGSTLSSINQRDDFSAGIRGLLPTGATYDLGWAGTNSRGTFNNFGDNFTSGPTAALRQPLLRNFGFAANLAQIRIARANSEISEWQLRNTAINVVTEVVFIYNELHFAIENLEVARRSRSLAQRLFQDNTRRAEIGVMSPLDITTARAEVASREEAVIVAERRVRDNENFLKQLISNDLERILVLRLQVVPPVVPLEYETSVEEGIQQALEIRPDYQQALLDIRRRGINLAFIKNQALPRLDLVGSLRLLGADNDLGTSIDRSIRRDRSEWSAGAVMSIPFPNRERLGNLNATRLEREQALINLKALEQDIVVSVDNAAGRVVTSRERIISTREAVRLAFESLDAGQERLLAGTGTTFEVLELQEKFATAENAQLRAQADFNRAVADYERQTGTTLLRHGITIGE